MREYCKHNSIDLLPSDIIELFVLWLSFCDRFVPDLSDDNIEILGAECQQVKVRAGGGHYCATAVCKDIVKKGEKQSWKFQVVDKEVILGIMEDKVAVERAGKIRDFSSSKGGYGLFLSDMRKYLDDYNARVFEYAQQFEVKENDIITMELDLTKDKGVLTFTFHSKEKPQITDNIFYDQFEVNKNWRAAVVCTDQEPSLQNIVSLIP